MTLYYVTYKCFVVFVLFLIIKDLRFQRKALLCSYCFFLLSSLNVVHAVFRKLFDRFQSFYYRWLYLMLTNYIFYFFLSALPFLIYGQFCYLFDLLYNELTSKIIKYISVKCSEYVNSSLKFCTIMFFFSDAISWSSPGHNKLVRILNEKVLIWIFLTLVLTYTCITKVAEYHTFFPTFLLIKT